MKTKAKKTKAKARRDTGYGAKMLVQTVIPKHVAAALRTQAAAEGLSMAAWVRRLLTREKERDTSNERSLQRRLDRVEEHVRRLTMAVVRAARGGSFHEPNCPAAEPNTTLSDCVCWVAMTCAGCGRVIGEDMGHRPDCANRQPKGADALSGEAASGPTGPTS